MTLLKHEDLWAAIKDRPVEKALVVTPMLDEEQVGEATIDLRLGTEFLALRRTMKAGLDPTEFSQAEVDRMQERILVPYGEELWLHPGHFVLAATLEYLGCPPISAPTSSGAPLGGGLV